jgi:hypothetical protein
MPWQLLKFRIKLEEGMVSLNSDSLKTEYKGNESPALLNKDPSSENMEPTGGEDSEMKSLKQVKSHWTRAYSQKKELPQLRVIDNILEYSMKLYSELYGCEHLLRLFVRLPEMLMDQISDYEARPVFAKVKPLFAFH